MSGSIKKKSNELEYDRHTKKPRLDVEKNLGEQTPPIIMEKPSLKITMGDSSDSEEENDNIETQTVLEQLQNILQQYPDNAQILRELVQNAEDAGACKMKMLFMSSLEQGPETKLTERSKYFKPPGICVYNDAMFTEEDWEGIGKIYKSNKRDKPLQVGRFGLGFKSVFHMTDNPVIISGEKILVIDPFHTVIINNQAVLKELRSFKLKKIQTEGTQESQVILSIMDAFGFDKKSFTSKGDKEYKGTLFWFSLRQRESELSKTIYSEERVELLFKSFVRDGPYNLLFLKSLEKIELYDGPKHEHYSCIEMKGTDAKYYEERKKFNMELKELKNNFPKETITSRYQAVISVNGIEETFWVVNSLFSKNSLSDGLDALLTGSDGKTSRSPYTGIAYCCKSESEQKRPGHVFVFLPLPVTDHSMTGLPFHVNGFFELEQNRRHLKEAESSSETKDEAISWNERMIQELLSETFRHLMHNLKEECIEADYPTRMVQNVYDAIPVPDQVLSCWKLMLHRIYRIFLEDDFFFTNQDGGKWITLDQSLLAVFDDEVASKDVQTTVKEFLLDAGTNLVEVPENILKVLKFMDHKPEAISPNRIIEKLKCSNCWIDYPLDKKLHLLEFILHHNNLLELKNIKLLPLKNGLFTSFNEHESYNMDQENMVLIIEDKLSNLLPGLESKFVSKLKLPQMVYDRLEMMAQEGMFQLRMMGPQYLPTLLKKLFRARFTDVGGNGFVSAHKDHGKEWIEAVWKEVAAGEYQNLSEFEEIPLIPYIHPNGESDNEHLHFFKLKGKYLLAHTEDNELNLPGCISLILKLIDVRLFFPHQIKFPDGFVIGKYILRPTPVNVFSLLKEACLSVDVEDLAERIEEECTPDEMISIGQYFLEHLIDIPREIHKLLWHLKIFKQSRDQIVSELVSLAENQDMVDHFAFPKTIRYPQKFLEHKFVDLAKLLGATLVGESKCVEDTLRLMNDKEDYSVDEKVQMMKYIQEKSYVIKDDTLLNLARSVVFIPSSDGNIHHAGHLFNPRSKTLTDMFDGQTGIFPDEKFLIDNGFDVAFLEKLGLKGEDELGADDMINIAKHIHNAQANEGGEISCLRKINTFITFMKSHTELICDRVLEEISDINWVLSSESRPDGYPENLKWWKRDRLFSPNEVKSIELKHLIGSVSPLVDSDLYADKVRAYFQWNVTSDETQILEHLQNVIDSFQPSQNAEYMLIVRDLFKFFHERDTRNDHDQLFERLKTMRCIPTNKNKLEYPEKVVKQMDPSQINYSLEPYIYEMATEVLPFCSTLIYLGMQEKINFDILKDLLKRIKERYEADEVEVHDCRDVVSDRKIVANILRTIVEMKLDKTLLTDMFVPIMSENKDRIKFEIVEKCSYAPGKSDLSFTLAIEDDDQSESEKIVYIHNDVKDIAQELGVASITKRFMMDQNTKPMAWGQEEKLTSRISGLLDSYTDGLAVPKELIQNADDAGASKVWFLYDERDNFDSRDNLFDPGMAECQGPALWVYNDAVFEEKDFKNIIALGGKTKLEDTSKIGKFGLGFCSVYNLTDVPSFISKNILVILDPHLDHLGEAAIGTNPGLRIPLTSGCKKKFSDQLKPFNNVFGCNLSQKAEYRATLFRLPLRTSKQAGRSEIKSLQYTKREVVELLHKFIEAAGNLLLFTQNVTEVSIYHLDSRGQNPDKDMELIYKVVKEVTNGSKRDTNVLRNVAETVKSSDQVTRNEIPLPMQNVKIQLELFSPAENLFKEIKDLPIFQNVTDWLVSWGTGRETFELAQKLKTQGAIPVGTVAVPVQLRGTELIDFLKLEDLPLGFYKESRIFCFLPLPMNTRILNVHINGCFMVEQDRKSIIRYNQDSKSNDGHLWNRRMLTDVVQSAFLNLMTYIAGKNEDQICRTDYWRLWPLFIDQDEIFPLSESFYKRVMTENDTVFYRHNPFENNSEATSFEGSVFLDPEFRHSNKCGSLAFDCLLHFHNKDQSLDGDGRKLMDMPLDKYTTFLGIDKELMARQVISKKTFFQDYFFPRLDDKFWKHFDAATTMYALLKEALEDEQLHTLVSENHCMPVKGSKQLRKPCELVRECGNVSTLFNEEDGRFLDSKFEQYEDILLNMGMMDKHISSEMLLERANSIRTLDADYGMIRSSAIISYLNENIGMHTDVTSALKEVAFLPVMQRPPDWPLAWKGEELPSRFLEPTCLFSFETKDIVGSVGYVVDTELTYEVTHSIELKVVTADILVQQMEAVAEADRDSSDGLKGICEQLYNKLNCCLTDNRCSVDIKARLSKLVDSNVVMVDKIMAKPCQVSFYLNGTCSPYLFRLPTELKQYNDLWNYTGMHATFPSKKFYEVILKIEANKRQLELEEDEIQSFINILTNLSRCDIEEDVKANLFVPDNNGVLQHIDNVCYDDPDFQYTDEDVFVTHGQLTMELIEKLGIKSKKHLYLSRFSDSIPFGQKEKLVTRLKGILDAYPKDHSVLNELLQNADDAGATEVHFVLDLRQLETKEIFDKKWTPLQGPSLCVYNDACFTEDDLRGIQNLGEGSKSKDPTKTGQFGVGFNAVYHLTDAPSFMTKGEECPGGGTFCAFDPHCSFLSVAQPSAPGMRLNLDRLKTKYGHVYDGYLQNIISSEKGTWFRLPLRTKEMAEMSEISKNACNADDVKNLLNEMKNQMLTSLLFISNVRKISISTLTQGSNELSETYSVTRSIPDEWTSTFEDFSKYVASQLKKIKTESKKMDELEFKEARYVAVIDDNCGRSDYWAIVKGFGFSHGNEIPRIIIDQASRNEIGFLPTAGTAMHILSRGSFQTEHNIQTGKEDKNTEYDKSIGHGENAHHKSNSGMGQSGTRSSESEQGTRTGLGSYTRLKMDIRGSIGHGGNAFCFLPLPIKTGLPVHINGHFSVLANRNALFSENVENDSRAVWNNTLLQDTVAHTYASCIEYSKELIPMICKPNGNISMLDKFFGKFPNYTLVNGDYWRKLVKAVYLQIYERQLAVFPICPEFSQRTHDLKNVHQNTIVWQPLKSASSRFDLCFDKLSSWYKNFDVHNIQRFSSEEGLATLKRTREEENTLRHILVDIGVKLTCTPLWIFESLCETSPSKQNSSHHQPPHNATTMQSTTSLATIFAYDMRQELSDFVFAFLGSWNEQNEDGCLIREINVPIENSVFKSVCNLSAFVKFCLTLSTDSSHYESLPILVDNSNQLKLFAPTLILSTYCNLLKESGDKFVHEQLVENLWRFNDFFVNFSIAEFCRLLPSTVKESKMQIEGPIEMNVQEDAPSLKWFIRLWSYLETVDFDLELEKWCFFPITSNDKLELVSFDKAFIAVDYSSFDLEQKTDEDLVKILKKIKIPEPAKEIVGSSKHSSRFASTKKRPDNLARCLKYHKEQLNACKLTEQECNILLSYFSNWLEQSENVREICDSLRQIEIFPSVFGRISELSKSQDYLVVDISSCSFQPSGLEELSNAANVILIKQNDFHAALYKQLQLPVCRKHENEHKLLELYTNFVLPRFALIPENSRITQLHFIKDYLLRSNLVQQKLQACHIIPCGLHFKRAKEFYSPHVSVFRSMCMPSEMPPAPFDSIVWKVFMEKAGMICTLDQNMFLEFAYQIETGDGKEEQSTELVQYLFNEKDWHEDDSFLCRVREIRFVRCSAIPDKLVCICPQFLRNTLISFRNAIPYSKHQLAWTMAHILPKYASPGKSSLREKLGIQQEPNLTTFISHVQKVCHSLQRHPHTNLECMYDLIKTFYNYMGKGGQDLQQLRARLAETPFIHIEEHGLFYKPRDVVIQAPYYDLIEPYFMKCSERYGYFFSLFRSLGVKDCPDIDNYLGVLIKIKERVGEKSLNPDYITIVEKAVHKVLFLLQNMPENTQPVLREFYLLSDDLKLCLSSDLVLRDRVQYEKRLEDQHQIKFLKDMKQFEKVGIDVKSCLKQLPNSMQPNYLSHMVSEQLYETNDYLQTEDFCQLNSFLSSGVFINAMLRIGKTCFQNDERGQQYLEKIETNLKLFRIQPVKRLQTILVNKDVQIQSSIKDLPYFHLQQDGSTTLFMAYDFMDFTKWLNMKIYAITYSIIRLCSHALQKMKDKIQNVISSYTSSEEEILELLDNLEIVELDFKPPSLSWVPLPGSPVPQDLLDLLIQDIIEFKAGDYAVYEVFDSVNEELLRDQPDSRMYIYVRIIKKCGDNFFPTYEIDVGDGLKKTVCSFDLYQVVHQEEEHTEVDVYTDGHASFNVGNKNLIIKGIEESLIRAYRMGEKPFRKVYKRMLLKWHPDKNPENQTFATEVTQHIISFATKLLNGEIKIDDIPEYREWYRDPNQDYNAWDEHVNRGSANNQKFTFDTNGFADDLGRRSGRRNTDYKQEQYQPNPQKLMGRVWFKQAKSDIIAAESLLTIADQHSFNWVCVLCQQAAEKALKAVQVCIDARKVDTKGHSLLYTIMIGGENLHRFRDAAQRLENCYQEYTRMRYPKEYACPDTPSELYTKAIAEEALVYAMEIVSGVGDMM